MKRHSSWQRCGQANPSSQGDHRSASGVGHRRSSRRNHGAVRLPLWVYQRGGNLRLQDRSVEGGALEEVADHVLMDLARPLNQPKQPSKQQDDTLTYSEINTARVTKKKPSSAPDEVNVTYATVKTSTY
ncbi:UNVERIFIED_CONTAM: hypothetical protein FKN15_059154 [Acipenser sinensis]